ncbi:hypothetical protein I79_018686 [Cricetulus griseus]|uniref:Uncharacterized protein n=1 Tax=Cricetulus griseus TaxID=10029 RepID=G3I5E1_CRIGR|nr:hypothetical protein I79_018686 [Cricetulus griseus]
MNEPFLAAFNTSLKRTSLNGERQATSFSQYSENIKTPSTKEAETVTSPVQAEFDCSVT